jgi:hypothetical protein
LEALERLELRESHRYGEGSGEVKVGDIVVVHSEEKDRGFWKLVRINRVLSSRDGVRVHQEANRTTLWRRPVQRLYPIEVSWDTIATHENEQLDQEPSLQIDQIRDDAERENYTEGDSNSGNIPRRRSSRVTARVTRDCILACQHQL